MQSDSNKVDDYDGYNVKAVKLLEKGKSCLKEKQI